MDLYGVEKGLDHYESTSYLTFKQYMLYLQKEVSLNDDNNINIII